jgi:hypothetical protein
MSAWLPGFLSARLPGWPASSSCLAPRSPSSRAACLPGSLVSYLPGCLAGQLPLAAWLLGRLALGPYVCLAPWFPICPAAWLTQLSVAACLPGFLAAPSSLLPAAACRSMAAFAAWMPVAASCLAAWASASILPCLSRAPCPHSYPGTRELDCYFNIRLKYILYEICVVLLLLQSYHMYLKCHFLLFSF